MKPTKSIYDIYHDESEERDFWHIFLFVPKDSMCKILPYLIEARKISKFKGNKLSFKNLFSTSSFECAKAWMSILVSSLQQTDKSQMQHFCLGKTEYDKKIGQRKMLPNKFECPLKLKVCIFHQKNEHKDMKGHYDELSKIETTFRMALQGACHFLFDKNNPLVIGNIFLDGYKHYLREHKRNFNDNKVLLKLKDKFRDYCNFQANTKFHYDYKKMNDEYKLFSQLADIFLGTFRFGYLYSASSKTTEKEEKKLKICEHIKPLIEKLNRGKNMCNSSYYKFGLFSSAFIENDEWKFESLHKKFMNPKQQKTIPMFSNITSGKIKS